MRTRLVLVGAALGVALGVAHAGKVGKSKDVVSIDSVKERLVVLRTDGGHYVVVEPFDISSDHFYFGDGKNLYRQRSRSGSRNGTKTFSRSIWAPRVNHRAEVGYRKGAWYVECGERETPLSEVTGPEAAKVLDKGTYHVPLWKRQAYHLSRDDRGRYYFVDRLQNDYGGKGFRLFIGMKGKMKLTKLTNIVSDSEGDIFSTRKGDLRFVINRKGESQEVKWVKGKKKTDLRSIPLWRNIVLIYDELGVYDGEIYGTPCDYY